MKYMKRPILYLLIPLILLIYIGDVLMEYPFRMLDHYTHYEDVYAGMLVKVLQPVKVKQKSIQVEAEVLMKVVREDTIRCSGKILLYVEKESKASEIAYGDVLWIQAKPRKFTHQQSANDFDVGKYYRHQRIYRYAWIPETQWIKVDHGQGSIWKETAWKAKEYVMNLFDMLFPEGEYAGMLSALFLNDKQTMDTDLLQTYRQVGLAHVLCVSGLHVGMISVAVGVFLSVFLFGNKSELRWRAWLSVLGTWVFCFVVGWQPSVMRAAVMFAFITLGKVYGRKGDSFNNLFLAAFLLLLREPLWLFDIGFQLSFMAVLGILFFLPPAQKWQREKNPFLKYVITAVSVSLGAQCFTLPLCLYYFHQLPLLSIVANLFVLPLVNVIIVSVLTACVMVSFGMGVEVARWVLEMELNLMNFLTRQIHNIPFAYLEQIRFSEALLWITYTVFFFLLWGKNRHRQRHRPPEYSAAKNACILDIMKKDRETDGKGEENHYPLDI